MKNYDTLRNSLWILSLTAGVVACDVQRREVATMGLGALPHDDAGQDETPTDETSTDGGQSSSSTESSPGDDGGPSTIDAGFRDAQASSEDEFDAASDAAPDAKLEDAGLDAGEPEIIIEPRVRGYYVVESDYSSINVSVWSSTGDLLSASLISSSSEDPGLSGPFTSDVVPPSEQQQGDEVVLIDRTSGVLTWVNLETATVTQQLDVKTGFESDPHDYVAYDENTAFVPRFAANGASGAVEYDHGSDLLIINPSTAEITGSIDLSPAMQGETQPASPDRAILAGGLIRVLLVGWDGLSTFAPARLVSVDPVAHEITHVLVLDGIQNCTTLTLSPTGTSMALACWGPWSSDETLQHSGIVQVSVEAEPEVLLQLPATALGGEQINTVAFTGPSTLVYSTFGRSDYDTFELLAPDTLRFLDLTTGLPDSEPVLSVDASFVLGDVRCSTVGKRCFLADASTNGGILRQLAILDDGRVEDVTPDLQDAMPHVMPPRYLGAF